MATSYGSAVQPKQDSGINLQGTLASNPQYGLLNQPVINKNIDVANNPIPTPAPVVPVYAQPNVITGGEAKNDVTSKQDTLQGFLDQQTLELANQKAELAAKTEQAIAANEQNIKNDYQGKQNKLASQQGEESATSKALQFKLGREATLYADAEKQKLNQAHLGQVQDLTNQMNALIAQSNKAIRDEEYTKARNLQQDANDTWNKLLQINQEKRAQESADLEKLTKQASINKLEREEVQAVANDYAANIYQDLTSNPEANFEDMINQYAEQTGVNPIVLSSAVLRYSDEKRKEDILGSEKTVSLLQNINFTGKVNLPGVGEVEIKPKGDYSIVQQKGGALFIFDKNTGTVKKAPISSNQLTTENVLGALDTIQQNSTNKAISGVKPLTGYDLSVARNLAISVIPTQLRNTEKEQARYLKLIDEGFAQGKTAFEVADDLMGYKVATPSQFSENLRGYISRANLEANKIPELARLINNGDQVGAVSLIEDNLMNQARKTDPQGYFGESTARIAVERANDITKLYNELVKSGNSPIGVVKGTFEDWLGRLKGSEAQSLKTKITQAVAQTRNQLSGTALTENEERFLKDIIPTLGDSPANFVIKLRNLQTNPIQQLNSTRAQFDLPNLDASSLLNKSKRVGLYGSTSPKVSNQSGTIKVKDRKTGQTGNIPEGEFDANSYEKI